MLSTRFNRRQLLGLLATVGALPLVAACGGGGDGDDGGAATVTRSADGTPDSTDPPVVMSTFTPQPATPTPGASPTGGTATPEGTPGATTTPSQPAPGEPTPTQAPNEIRAPLVTLRSANGSSLGWVSEFTWYDPELESIGGIFAPPYSTLPPESMQLLVAPDESIELSVADSPFPVTAMSIDLYPAEENIAIPTDPAGNPLTTTFAFVPQTEPVLSDSFTSAPASVANDLPLGRYIAEIRVDWTLPADVAAQVQRPVYVICIAVIEIA